MTVQVVQLSDGGDCSVIQKMIERAMALWIVKQALLCPELSC